MVTQYEDRDPMALDEIGGYYSRHVSAMTREGLHAKTDIAAELAVRDCIIDELKGENSRLAKQRDELLEALEEVTEYAEMAMEQANKAGSEWEIGYALYEAKIAIAKAKGGAVNHFPDATKMVPHEQQDR